MLVNRYNFVKYGIIVSVLIALVTILIILKPIRSYLCYDKLTNDIEFLSLMDEYVFLILDYTNTTFTYPSKMEIQKYYPNLNLLEKDIDSHGVIVEHIFRDSVFAIKVVCKRMDRSYFNFSSNRQTYWSFLFNKSIVWQSFDRISKSSCITNNWLTLLKSGQHIEDSKSREKMANVFSDYFKSRLNYKAYCHYKVNNDSIEVLCEEGSRPENFNNIRSDLKLLLDQHLLKIDIDEIYFRIK